MLGGTTRFAWKDGSFTVTCAGANGKSAMFAIPYAAGVSPLRQFVVATERGELQALRVAWDSRFGPGVGRAAYKFFTRAGAGGARGGARLPRDRHPARTLVLVGGSGAQGLEAERPEPPRRAARRAPAILRLLDHDIYYYDGNGREVRRLSPDLREEEVLVSDFVCSPLAVADRVYCANVEGIFELVSGGRPRPLVTLGLGATVCDLAADGRRLFWIADAGPDRLTVKAIDVSGPPAP